MRQVTISQEAYNTLREAARQHIDNSPSMDYTRVLKALNETPTIISEPFTPEQIDTIIMAILCDGLHFFGGYGFALDYSQEEYQEAKALTTNPSIEDVQLTMLKLGYGLTFTDLEGDSDQTTILTYDLIKEKLPGCPESNVQNILNEEYDAEDCDILLQHILFGEIVYG